MRPTLFFGHNLVTTCQIFTGYIYNITYLKLSILGYKLENLKNLKKLHFDCKSVPVAFKINLLISSFIDFISFSKFEESAA